VRVLALLLVLATLGLACGDDGGESAGSPSGTPSSSGTATPLPTTTVVFVNAEGDQVELLVEVADESAERSRGLMFRESLAEDAGMIFVYESDHQGSFYMRNTLIPLSIAWVVADGTIIDIQDMEPETLTSHSPGQPYRYAIEVNQGWYQRNGIAVGDAVLLPDALAGDSETVEDSIIIQ
jgi:uncharacterized membrane protein (UPF0127 family)